MEGKSAIIESRQLSESTVPLGSFATDKASLNEFQSAKFAEIQSKFKDVNQILAILEQSESFKPILAKLEKKNQAVVTSQQEYNDAVTDVRIVEEMRSGKLVKKVINNKSPEAILKKADNVEVALAELSKYWTHEIIHRIDNVIKSLDLEWIEENQRTAHQQTESEARAFMGTYTDAALRDQSLDGLITEINISGLSDEDKDSFLLKPYLFRQMLIDMRSTLASEVDKISSEVQASFNAKKPDIQEIIKLIQAGENTYTYRYTLRDSYLKNEDKIIPFPQVTEPQQKAV